MTTQTTNNPPTSQKPFLVSLPVSEEEFRALWDAGYTQYEIAKKFGVPHRDVFQYIRALKLPPQKKSRPELLRAEFSALWGNPHYNIDAIAKHFDIPRKRVTEWARKLKLPFKQDAEDSYPDPHPGDPSPDEIKKLAAHYRARRLEMLAAESGRPVSRW